MRSSLYRRRDGNLRPLPIHKDDEGAALIQSAFLVSLLRVSASLRLNPIFREVRQGMRHRGDAETQRRTPIGGLGALRPLRALPIHQDDEGAAHIQSAFLVFLLCVSASLRLNSVFREVRQGMRYRRDAETQRRTPIGNLGALRPLRALPIRKDDEGAAHIQSAFLVFLLCVSASLRLNSVFREVRQGMRHRGDAATQRGTPIGNLGALRPLRALPIRKDDEGAAHIQSAFLVFLLCVSASLRLNPIFREVRQGMRYRGDAATQRRTPIGNLGALRPLRALPIRKDDEGAAHIQSAFLVFLLCVSASLRLNPIFREATYAR